MVAEWHGQHLNTDKGQKQTKGYTRWNTIKPFEKLQKDECLMYL